MTAQKQNNIFSYYKSNQQPFRKCCREECKESGQHKVILNPQAPQEVVYMCLEHAKKHNQTINYFKNMGIKEIESEIRADTVWRLPTWPLRGDYRRLLNYEDFFRVFEADREPTSKISDLDYLPKEIQEAMIVMEVSFPCELKQLKKIYKTKVREHHPDLNSGKKSSEEKLKKINIAYKTLFNYLTNV